MFSSLPFSTDTFSSLGINLVEGVSLLDAIAVIEAKAGLKLEDTASIEGVAILTADGTLTLGGSSVEIAPARATTWTIPVDVGASTWILPS